MSTGAFTLGYLVLPAASVRLGPALAGGATAGLLWEAGKAAFDWYVRRFASFEQIYGALALVPIFLLWVQVTWLIVLFGAEVACCAQHPDPGPETAPARRDGHARGPLAARVLWVVAREFAAGRPRPTVAGLAAELSVEGEAVERAVGALARAGLVARVAEPADAEGDAGLLPARPLEQITVADALRAGEAEGGGLAEGDEGEEPLYGLLRAAAREVEERLGRETYASLSARWLARQRGQEAEGAIPTAAPATLPEGLAEGREP